MTLRPRFACAACLATIEDACPCGRVLGGRVYDEQVILLRYADAPPRRSATAESDTARRRCFAALEGETSTATRWAGHSSSSYPVAAGIGGGNDTASLGSGVSAWRRCLTSPLEPGCFHWSELRAVKSNDDAECALDLPASRIVNHCY